MGALTDHHDVPSSPSRGVQPGNVVSGELNNQIRSFENRVTHILAPGHNKLRSDRLVVDSRGTLLAHAFRFESHSECCCRDESANRGVTWRDEQSAATFQAGWNSICSSASAGP